MLLVFGHHFVRCRSIVTAAYSGLPIRRITAADFSSSAANRTQPASIWLSILPSTPERTSPKEIVAACILGAPDEPEQLVRRLPIH
jgi:hypothetical protein